jgi:MoaA/NifB/PqqE/SkfB family radical SAM enzyme
MESTASTSEITGRSLPKLDLNITNRCNLRCKHCAFDSGCVNISEMNLEQLTTILQDTRLVGGQRIDVTGGEPTFRADHLEVLITAKSLGYQVELVTNSLLLDQDKISNLKKLGLDAIAISLDGADWKTHFNVRGVREEEYNNILRNISYAAKIGIKTKINTSVFDFNYTEIPEIIKRGTDLGVAEVGLYYFTPIGRGAYQLLNSVEPISWLRFVRENLLGHKIKVSVEVPLIEQKLFTPKMGCISIVDPYHLQILPDGKAYPCAIMAHHHQPIGDLSVRSVKELWEDKTLWANYRGFMKEWWKNNNGCINFSNFSTCDYAGYVPVCPLQKYSPKQLAGV